MKSSTAVILPAAGSGKRFGGPKVLIKLKKRPLLLWSLNVCEKVRSVKEVVVVVRRTELASTKRWVRKSRSRKVSAVVAGGATRAQSVYRGLKAISSDADVVAVHDAARPLVSVGLFKRVIGAAQRYGAALAGVPMVATTKQVNKQGRVVATVDRSKLWMAQTPQAFRRSVLERAYRRAKGRARHQATDESSLVERCGVRPVVVEDSLKNLKVTRPADLRLAEALLKEKS